MASSRAQSAIEFVMLVGVVLLFFAVFFLAIQESTADKVREKQDLIVRDTAMAIQDEINLALESSNGYSREFIVPEKIGSQDYKASLVNGMIYIRTNDNKSAIALPVPGITGSIVKGKNTIKKLNDSIYIN